MGMIRGIRHWPGQLCKWPNKNERGVCYYGPVTNKAAYVGGKNYFQVDQDCGQPGGAMNGWGLVKGGQEAMKGGKGGGFGKRKG